MTRKWLEQVTAVQPHCGITTSGSEKDDKRRSNRVERRTNAQILAATGDADRLKPSRILSDPWNMEKDGKQRFDPRAHPCLMRK
jgi:hypothetical protein